MRLSEMTSPELGAVATGTVVLIPMGALEQHGPHLPLATDSIIAGAVADAVERAAPADVLLLPVLEVGHSPHHLRFPGTLSFSHPTVAVMVEEIVSSLIPHGFQRFLIVNGHGGNQLPITMAQQALKNRNREHPDVSVVAVNYWAAAREVAIEVRDSPYGGMGHACELETSILLSIAPTTVRRDLIVDGGQQPLAEPVQFDMFGGSPATAVYDFDEITDSGVFGMPSLADPSKGARIFAAAVAGVLDIVQAMARPVITT